MVQYQYESQTAPLAPPTAPGLLWLRGPGYRGPGCISAIIIACHIGVRPEINWLTDQRIARQERLTSGGGRVAADGDDCGDDSRRV